MNPNPPRPIDLHVDWLLQYAPESNLYAPGAYDDVAGRLPQAEGYLGTASAAVLSCWRTAADWASRPDPWRSLSDLMARAEAEFSGRLLLGHDDLVRWRDDPEGMAWGVLGVEGFDALVRSPADLANLSALFDRGVRVFQMSHEAGNALAGTSAPGDDGRGLLPLGRDFLVALGELARDGGPFPILDLSHLNTIAMAEVLDFFEAASGRSGLPLLSYTHGALRHEGCPGPRAIAPENLARLRALGGVIGFTPSPPFYDDHDQYRRGIEQAAAMPFRGVAGYAGITLGTDFLGVERTLPGLGTLAEVVDWFGRTLEPLAAFAILRGNAQDLVERMIGDR